MSPLNFLLLFNKIFDLFLSYKQEYISNISDFFQLSSQTLSEFLKIVFNILNISIHIEGWHEKFKNINIVR